MPRFYDQLEGREVDDVDPGFILAGDVSSLTSVGGGGKGALSVDEMARISRGWPKPPYAPDDPLVDWDTVATPGYCLHIPLEDDPERTVWWRLQAAGADMTRIALLDKVNRTKTSNASRSQFSLPDDLGVLRSEIAAIGDVRCVVIDPFMSAATTTVAFNQQLRNRILVPLIEVARDTGTGIWLVHHFTKGTNNGRLSANSQRSLTDYVAGSKGFTDTLRLNTVVVDDDTDDRIKVWKFLKGNGGGAEERRYMIVASKPNDPDMHIEWEQPQLAIDDPRSKEILQARILKQLVDAGQPMTPQAMVALVRVSYAMVDQAMRAMEKTGTLAKRRGAYQPAIAALPPAPSGRVSVSAVQAAAITRPSTTLVVPQAPVTNLWAASWDSKGWRP